MPRRSVTALMAVMMSTAAHAACVSELRTDDEARVTYAINKCEMQPEHLAYFIMARLRATNPLTQRFQHKMPALPPAIPPREVQ